MQKRDIGLFCQFQSTRPRGARQLELSMYEINGEFQSTRPRGARPEERIICDPPLRKFQSTRPRGARLSVSGNTFGQLNVSIHAPARGATRSQNGSGSIN